MVCGRQGGFAGADWRFALSGFVDVGACGGAGRWRGLLVRLFDVGVRSDFGYYFACTVQGEKKPQVAAFKAWLLAEIALFKAQNKGFEL